MDKFFLLAVVLALLILPRYQLNKTNLDFTVYVTQEQTDDNQDIPRSDEEGSEDDDDSDEGMAFA
jgi:hypothetical protein